MERWGIIYSPKSGVLRTHKRWEQIRRCLNEHGVEYDFVQSEGAGSEKRLAAMLAKNGYTTIIVVGGDGALNRAVNGVMEQDPEYAKTVTFGLIPNGHGNDYAKFWGFDIDNYEQTVEWLVKGRVRTVDLGLLHVNTDHGEKDRYFLNCVNVGLAANLVDIKHKTYRFWGMSSLSYVTSLFWLLFQRMETNMQFTINYEKVSQRFMSVCVGNCQGYGMTPNAVPYNGMLDVTTVSHPAIKQLVHGMYMLFSGRLLNHRQVRPYRTRGKVVFTDIGTSKVSADGQVWRSAMAPLTISVKQEFIRFIIPS